MPAREDGTDQSSILGKAVQQKLDELRQMDTRIEQRLDHLGRTEQNLRLLFDSLRSQVLQAHPLIGQLNQLRQQSASMIDSICERVQEKIATDALLMPQSVPQSGSMSASPASPMPQVVQVDMSKTVDAGLEAINARARALDTDMSAMVDTARHYIDHAFNAAREQAGQTLEAIQAKIDQAREVMAEVESQAVRPTAPPAVKSPAGDSAGLQLDEELHAFTVRAQAAIESVRRTVAQQVERLEDEARLEIRPLLGKIEDQRRAAEMQLASATENAEKTLQRRADDLKQNARADDGPV